MKLNIKHSVDLVLNYIRANVDPSATVSRKVKGQVVIHYAVKNGQVHTGNTPFVLYCTMNVLQVTQFCDDMEWTHGSIRKD